MVVSGFIFILRFFRRLGDFLIAPHKVGAVTFKSLVQCDQILE